MRKFSHGWLLHQNPALKRLWNPTVSFRFHVLIGRHFETKSNFYLKKKKKRLASWRELGQLGSPKQQAPRETDVCDLKQQVEYALLGFGCGLPSTSGSTSHSQLVVLWGSGTFRGRGLAGGSRLLKRRVFLFGLCFWATCRSFHDALPLQTLSKKKTVLP